MRHKLFWLGLFLVALIVIQSYAVLAQELDNLGAWSGPSRQADVPADLAAIHVVTSGIISADNAGGATAVIRFYADDAVLPPPNGAPVVGKDRIRAC